MELKRTRGPTSVSKASLSALCLCCATHDFVDAIDDCKQTIHGYLTRNVLRGVRRATSISHTNAITVSCRNIEICITSRSHVAPEEAMLAAQPQVPPAVKDLAVALHLRWPYWEGRIALSRQRFLEEDRPH